MPVVRSYSSPSPPTTRVAMRCCGRGGDGPTLLDPLHWSVVRETTPRRSHRCVRLTCHLRYRSHGFIEAVSFFLVYATHRNAGVRRSSFGQADRTSPEDESRATRLGPGGRVDGVLANPRLENLRTGDPCEIARCRCDVADRVKLRRTELERAAQEVAHVAAVARGEQHPAHEARAPGQDATERHDPNHLEDPGVHSDALLAETFPETGIRARVCREAQRLRRIDSVEDAQTLRE